MQTKFSTFPRNASERQKNIFTTKSTESTKKKPAPHELKSTPAALNFVLSVFFVVYSLHALVERSELTGGSFVFFNRYFNAEV